MSFIIDPCHEIDGQPYAPSKKYMNGLIKILDSKALIDKEPYRVEYVICNAVQAMCDKDWEKVEQYAEYRADAAVRILNIGRNTIPEELQCKIALFHYDHKGNLYPIITDLVAKSIKYRPTDWRETLPASVRDRNTFTVYRAGAESPDKVGASLSWTLLRDVAEWFLKRNEYYRAPEQHLYQATIKADDVITYIGGRDEFEILQKDSVTDISELTPQGTSREFDRIHDMKDDSPLFSSRDRMILYFNEQMGLQKSVSA